jgi:hypothetical protein
MSQISPETKTAIAWRVTAGKNSERHLFETERDAQLMRDELEENGWLDVVLMPLYAGLAQRPTDREAAAKIIYELLPYDLPYGHKPKWVPQGNSLKQDECRRAVDQILALSDTSTGRRVDEISASSPGVPKATIRKLLEATDADTSPNENSK